MLTEKQIDDLFISRYYYKYGNENLVDTLYEQYMNVLRKEQPDHILVTRHWSQDPIPVELLTKYQLPFVEIQVNHELEHEIPEEIAKLREEYLTYYAERFSDTSQKSIELIQDYDTIYNRVADWMGSKVHLSIKADGFNMTTTYFKGKLVYAETKGRKGTPFEITSVMRLVLPVEIDTTEEVIKVSGELVCYKHTLLPLRSKYKQKFKSTRSAVGSLLRGGLDLEDIRKYLKPLIFKVRSENLHSLSEEFEWARVHGFNSPVSLSFELESWEQLLAKMTELEPLRETLAYSSDGLVLALDDNTEFYSQGQTDHHYSGNLALKVGAWDVGFYVGYVEDIVWSASDFYYSPEAIITPVKVANGNDVTSIPLNHTQRIIDHHIDIGSEIYFKITGESKITLVYKEEDLEKMDI